MLLGLLDRGLLFRLICWLMAPGLLFRIYCAGFAFIDTNRLAV